MKKYKVRVAKTTIEYVDIELEAEDRQHAIDLAEEEAWEIEEGWKCTEQSIDIIEIDPNDKEEEGE